MKPKPAGLGQRYSSQFGDESVVAAYRTRPPYPESLLDLVLEVARHARPRLLDLGCGTGELSRRLAPRVASITAVDASERMVAQARTLPGGDAASIEWLVAQVEDMGTTGPFDLAVAAESFHWFDWPLVCGRLVTLVPSRSLLLVEGRLEEGSPWSQGLSTLIARSSTNRDFTPYDLVQELISRGCFAVQGRTRLGPEPFRQSVDDYVESIHSRNGFSRGRTSITDARTFDEAVRALVSPHAREGFLDLQIATAVAWGTVSSPQAE